MQRRALLAFGAIAAGAIGYRVFVWKSDEDLIRERIDGLAAAGSFSEGTNPAIYGANVKAGIKEAFAPNATVDADELGGAELVLDDVVAGAVQLAGRYQSATVTFPNPKITVKEGKGTATGYLVVEAAEHGAVARKEQRPISFELSEIDGEWRITRVLLGPRRS